MRRQIRILFLAAEPTDIEYNLQLGREYSRIKKEIELEANRDRFKVESEWAVTAFDLQKALRKYKPHIVHFSGHGGKKGIMLEDDSGCTQSVPKEALAALFKFFKEDVRLVFLNACYSEPQVAAFNQIIDFTIGMKRPVEDSAAITFAAAFYSGLSYGYSVEHAFEQARNLLHLNQLPDRDNPQLFTRRGVDRSISFLEHISSTSQVLRDGKGSRASVKAQKATEEPKVCLWVHGWIKRLYDRLPTVELDWTEYFNRDDRRVPSQQVWDQYLFEDLQQAKKRLDKLDKGAFIDFRGKLPLTAMVAIGAKFPANAGYRFRAEQPTHGKTVLWQSDAAPSNRRFKIVIERERERGGKGNVLVALSITGRANSEVTALYNEHPETYSALVYAEPDSGTGEDALSCDSDAIALSNHAKELIRDSKLEHNASQVHLIIYAPAAYCLFLGQRLNALGTIVIYERTLDEGYQPSVTLQTG